MGPAQPCPRCGASRMANAPAGLCPRCLLGHGLRAGLECRPDAEGGGVGETPTGQWGPPRQSGVLSTVDRAALGL